MPTLPELAPQKPPLPPPAAVRHILIWHQGGLGDLLLAGPALAAVSRHYPEARLTALGHRSVIRRVLTTLNYQKHKIQDICYLSPLVKSIEMV